MAYATHADGSFSEVLTHNPMRRGQQQSERTWRTYWGPAGGRQLKAMVGHIPKGWRMPALPRTASGRNYALFSAVMRWAGSEENLGWPALAELERLNALLPYPLDHAELRWIGKSVERYRAQWQAQGRFYTQAEIFAYQSARGQQSGKARRKNTQERDREIVALYRHGGYTQRQLATMFAISPMAVNHVIRRDK